ncbi:MAG: hypothetical protein E6J20_06095 [Chloroflexi bacterium]|nr:MAG: hypothetical protein E6J20_06095 [Chloroflexota bacterium]
MDARVAAWWEALLAGEGGEAHPIYGERISARVAGEKLEISGEVDRRKDRDDLIAQARACIGNGVQEVDASRLKVAERHEQTGLLDQTLVAAFPDRATADLARKSVLEHARVKPKREEVVDRSGMGKLPDLLPAAFLDDARARIERGDALLILRVDETDAFKLRGLLDEDARSTWTIATPPQVAARG